MVRRVSLTEMAFVNADIPYVRCSHTFRHVNLKPPEHRLAVVKKKTNKGEGKNKFELMSYEHILTHK